MKNSERKFRVFSETKTYLLENMEKILKNYDGLNEVAETVESLLKADKVFVYGVGRSGMVGRAFAMRLVQLGLRSYFIGESTTPIVTPQDLVVIISKTGETYSALQTANIVRRVGTKLIVITGKRGSKLTHAGNIVHYLTLTTNERKPDIAPLGTLFEITALLLFDCIIAELMDRMGENEDTMRARHAIWV